MDASALPRRKLTTLDKLTVVLRQARCPMCGEKLGELAGLDFDHEHALARGGSDTLDNIRAVHRDCHAHKTTKLDIPEAAKTKRLTKANEENVRRMLAKAPGEKLPRKGKRAWPSRKFQNASAQSRDSAERG